MLKRAWLFVFALGIVVGTEAPAQTLPEQPIDQQAEGEGQQQSEAGSALPGFPVRILEDPEQSENAEREKREAEQREIEDLEAQQLAAESAQRSIWLGAVQTLIAFIGTGALIYSLYLNRKATHAAVEAAEAAAVVANSERAWVLFDAFNSAHGQSLIVDSVPHNRGFLVSMKWRNFGRTPAVNVSLYIAHRLIDIDEPIPTFSWTPPLDDQVAVMGPGGTGSTKYIAVVGDDLVRMERGEIRMIVYSRADYGNTITAGLKHTTEACGDVRLNGEVTDAAGRRVPNVTMTAIGPQNTAK